MTSTKWKAKMRPGNRRSHRMTSTSSKMTRTQWIRRSAIGLVAVALLAAPAIADDAAEAEATVRKTVDQVLEVLASRGPRG